MSEVPVSGLDVFYPIVPDADWLARLVTLGVRTVQLRIKDAPGEEVRRQIAASLAVTRAHRCQLIVNDYWREAIEAGAEWVHLGQEDLAGADLKAIKAARVRLGISTHSEAELESALAAEPDYVALGPDVRNEAQGHEVGAAGAGARAPMESAHRQISRSSPSAASRRSGRRTCLLRVLNRWR